MKKFGVLAAIGIFISAIGLIIATISITFAYNDYKNYSKLIEGKIELKEDLDYKFEFDYGTVNVFNTTEEYSYVEYSVVDFYEVKLDTNNFICRNKMKFLLSFLGYKNVLNIYLSNVSNDNTLDFTLNAGELKMDDQLTTSNTNIKLNAGKMTYNNISCTNNLTIKVNAGELIINDSKTNNLDVKINAGDSNIKSDFNTLDFTVNAGDFHLSAYGTKSDYSINVKCNAGDSNVSNGGSGARRISGTVNAGNFNAKFIN